jgi:hypothetical protein
MWPLSQNELTSTTNFQGTDGMSCSKFICSYFILFLSLGALVYDSFIDWFERMVF